MTIEYRDFLPNLIKLTTPSNDHNPIDIDVAKKTGMDDVFTQGMLSMAYLGQVLTNLV